MTRSQLLAQLPLKKAALSMVILFYCCCFFLMSCPRAWGWAAATLAPFEGFWKSIGSYYELNLFTPDPSTRFVRWEFEVVMDDHSTVIWVWPNRSTAGLDHNLYGRYFEVLMRAAIHEPLSRSVALFVARQCATGTRHPVLVRFIRCVKDNPSPELAQVSRERPLRRVLACTYRIAGGHR